MRAKKERSKLLRSWVDRSKPSQGQWIVEYLSKKNDKSAYSRPRLPLIPDEACHPFHAKAATDSTAKLPPWQAA